MTIVESIKCVLQNNHSGLTSKQIYDEIIRRGLYIFGAENPVGVVNAQLRRRCAGLDFPTAYPVKFFEIAGYEGKKIKFRLLSEEKEMAAITTPKIPDSSELLPEEKIKSALQEHFRNMRQQVFNCVLNNSPQFFEHLVIDLLLEMGYGKDKNSGVVTGRSHDGGIDGIISEDKLGLDLIYIQAKKYSPTNKVGRKEIQAFIGAMEHVQKGVFITTSAFTREAHSFVEKQQQKSIKLIDGELLADLLVKYRIGVNVAQSFFLFKLDTDYFAE
jgi:mrr restriction system protein